MGNTVNLNLPLVQASQAQKHVTVNEALSLLDGLCQISIESLDLSAPPIAEIDGQAYVVKDGATGAWLGRDGQVAVVSNGGWIFARPQAGWRCWIKDRASTAMFDGQSWQLNAAAVSANGAATVVEVLTLDEVITPGATHITAPVIPANCVVFGVTGRVQADLTGSLSAWSLGVPGGEGRYGSSLGLSQGSWIMGLTGQPLAYYSEAPLELVADGGTFDGGAVSFAVHLLRMTVPAG